MKYIFVIALAAFSTRLVAQVQPRSDNAMYTQKYQKFKGMKTGGFVLIVAGAVCTVVGFSDAINNTTTNNNTYPPTTTPDEGGVLLASVGLTMVGGGITLAVIGSKRMRYYKTKMNTVSLNFNSKPRQPGLMLTYKF